MRMLHVMYTTKKSSESVACIINFNFLQTLKRLTDQAKIPEGVSCMTISIFCERQFVLHDATLNVPKTIFDPPPPQKKNQNLVTFVLTISLSLVFKILSEVIHVLYNYMYNPH